MYASIYPGCPQFFKKNFSFKNFRNKFYKNTGFKKLSNEVSCCYSIKKKSILILLSNHDVLHIFLLPHEQFFFYNLYFFEKIN